MSAWRDEKVYNECRGVLPCACFSSHELVFHSLSLCNHYRQADNEQTKRPDIIMRVFFTEREKKVYF